MNREIIFRAQRMGTKEWLFGDLIQLEKDFTKVFEILDWSKVSDKKAKSKENLQVIPNTVGQFTGLTDKNGKKIFEGDLLQNDKEIIFEVQWHGALYGFFGYVKKWGSAYSAADFVNYIIVGNIHDNPELLVS